MFIWDMMMFGPWSVLILLPGLILGIYAQVKVSSTFNKYRKVPNRNGIAANMVAKEMLNKAGVYDVDVRLTRGNLSDHYDPKRDIVNLSETVYGSTSVASVGVAAHEIGHVLQKKKGYFPMKVRNALVPVVNFGTMAFFPLFLIGILIEMFVSQQTAISNFLINFAIIMYGGSTLFALVTLPVELNASRRAKKLLVENGILTKGETRQAGQVLDAAALTYLAAFVTSLLYFIRFLIMVGGMRGDD